MSTLNTEMIQLEADRVGMQAEPASLFLHTGQISPLSMTSSFLIVSPPPPQSNNVGLISHLRPLCSHSH